MRTARQPGARLESVEGSLRSAVVLRSVVDALDVLGVDTASILVRIGLSGSVLRDPDAWLPIALHNRLWTEVEQQTRDPLIGCRVAMLVAQRFDTVLSSLVQHSFTLGDAIIRLARFGRLLGTGFDTIVEIHGDRTALREPLYEGVPLHYQGVLCQLSVVGLIGCNLTQRRLPAAEVHMRAPRPPGSERLESIFGGPCSFGASHNALIIESSYLHLPIHGSDSARLQSIEDNAMAQLRSLPAEPSFAQAIRGLLLSGLAGNSMRELALAMHMHTRTVTRRLSAEGTSYQRLRAALRQHRACEYLRTTDLPALEIGILLGYSDGTAFTRAFKRWTGQAPTEYRAAHRHAADGSARSASGR